MMEEKRNLRQAFIFGFLTILMIIILLSFGFPALIKIIGFFGGVGKNNQETEKSDTIVPKSPSFYPVAEATNSAQISIKGYTEPEVKVKIILNGQPLTETLADSEGDFTIKRLTLTEGQNKIKAKVIDNQNNESDFSEELIIALDTESPILEISSPQDGDKFFDKDKEVKIEGSTEKEAAVLVNGRLAAVGSQGSFSTNLELKEGENKIIVKARDQAGNESEKEIKVTYSP